ncbi:CGNR zinc finger domain-containing protein [Herbiconiux sp. CPCC 203407]|uniref:CGNR zinc finger domain-containing protein n=1 Tax=Herbiconiux oxytropis TaxID=2970915 RepID=A0AA41XFK2_9MICO|nr:CGNR zinc finger domain-containing protein [Herbiconiux oxytropis]MCS5722304.1 CGNR zinc finger domain-containing protein [Herbiconiux oxytropis]MCS5727299.1 CGNR zinc finger domain-containing protein [Herbiconiux oxytropis]
MLFAYDTEATLAFAAALVNTEAAVSGSGDDELASRAQLVALLDENDYSGRRDGDDAELEEVRTLRPELRRFWEVERDEAVELVNAILREARALPQLVRHGDWDWHLHATDAEAPLATRMRVEVAMAFIDVIRSDDFDRLRTCAADDCDAVLVDLSRNRSKRYCDVGNCGNRMNVNAYRARRSAGASASASAF